MNREPDPNAFPSRGRRPEGPDEVGAQITAASLSQTRKRMHKRKTKCTNAKQAIRKQRGMYLRGTYPFFSDAFFGLKNCCLGESL